MLGLYTLRELILNNIDDTFTATFFNNLYIISITVIQFIEEICLLSISKKISKISLKTIYQKYTNYNSQHNFCRTKLTTIPNSSSRFKLTMYLYIRYYFCKNSYIISSNWVAIFIVPLVSRVYRKIAASRYIRGNIVFYLIFVYLLEPGKSGNGLGS